MLNTKDDTLRIHTVEVCPRPVKRLRLCHRRGSGSGSGPCQLGGAQALTPHKASPHSCLTPKPMDHQKCQSLHWNPQAPGCGARQLGALMLPAQAVAVQKQIFLQARMERALGTTGSRAEAVGGDGDVGAFWYLTRRRVTGSGEY